MQCLIHFLTFRHAGCVITEMKNKNEKLTKETLGKPLYLWSGPSLSSVAFVLFLRNNSGDEASETVNLKNETQLLLKRWTTIEFSTTKVAIRSRFRNRLREYSQSISHYTRTLHHRIFSSDKWHGLSNCVHPGYQWDSHPTELLKLFTEGTTNSSRRKCPVCP